MTTTDTRFRAALAAFVAATGIAEATAETGLAAAFAAAEAADGRRRMRHKKRGSTYRVAFEEAEVQASEPIVEGARITVYVCDEGGKAWARPVGEFNDGRFEPID